jgi:hypothetical protein
MKYELKFMKLVYLGLNLSSFFIPLKVPAVRAQAWYAAGHSSNPWRICGRGLCVFSVRCKKNLLVCRTPKYSVGVLVNCPPFLISLNFWDELVDACNSIWYQSQKSWVRVPTGALFKIITTHSNIHVCGLGEPAREGECWSISELPILSSSA